MQFLKLSEVQKLSKKQAVKEWEKYEDILCNMTDSDPNLMVVIKNYDLLEQKVLGEI